MWVFRKGGDSSDRRIESYANTLLGLFTVCAVLLIAFGNFDLQVIGVIAAVAVVVANKRTYRWFRSWYRGKRGKVNVVDVLRSLPNDYVVLNDLVMPERGGNVDHFLIGPNGLFVIEAKNYSGYVKCDGDRWFVYRREIDSLSNKPRETARRFALISRDYLQSKGGRFRTLTRCWCL